jgi:hypothetical protein
MTDTEILANLELLGFGVEQWRAVALLPLLAVAWADGRVQPAERARILEVAHQERLLSGPAAQQLTRWFTHRPTDGELEVALQVIEALAARQPGPSIDMNEADLRQIEERCEAVAKAAGGILGLAFTIDSEEAVLLDTFRRRLRRAASTAFSDLPTPEQGRFEDL